MSSIPNIASNSLSYVPVVRFSKLEPDISVLSAKISPVRR